MHSIVRKDASASPFTVDDLARAYRALQATAERRSLTPDRWVIRIEPEVVWSALLPVHSRKLQPYIREAWRRHER